MHIIYLKISYLKGRIVVLTPCLHVDLQSSDSNYVQTNEMLGAMKSNLDTEMIGVEDSLSLLYAAWSLQIVFSQSPGLSHPCVVCHSWLYKRPVIDLDFYFVFRSWNIFDVWLEQVIFLNLSPKREYVSVHRNCSVNQTNDCVVGMSRGFFFFFYKTTAAAIKG